MTNSKNYYLFLDESGHHGLKNINTEFPIFLLCGCLISEDDYVHLKKKINTIKAKYFGTKDLILHSTDIRKWQKEFKILGDLRLRNDFYNDLNKIIDNTNFTVISSAVIKEDLVKQYGPQASNPYEISLSFILDRVIMFSDKNDNANIKLIVESRGKKEDSQLHSQYQLILNNGTINNMSQKFKDTFIDIDFKKKKDNEIGTQLCDLIAYPLATKVIFPDRVNFAFNLIEKKLYKQFENGDYIEYGLKIFP